METVRLKNIVIIILVLLNLFLLSLIVSNQVRANRLKEETRQQIFLLFEKNNIVLSPETAKKDTYADTLVFLRDTQAEAALRLGISQSTVANKLRLLKLSPAERAEAASRGLSERHARVLLGIPAEARGEAIRRIAEGNLSVAQAEALAEELRPRHRAALRDIGIFYNSIDRALSILHKANIPATLEREESPRGVTVTIHVSRET